ncbi:hypothetical protein KIPB_016628, partial [Kipferlia bialata]
QGRKAKTPAAVRKSLADKSLALAMSATQTDTRCAASAKDGSILICNDDGLCLHGGDSVMFANKNVVMMDVTAPGLLEHDVVAMVSEENGKAKVTVVVVDHGAASLMGHSMLDTMPLSVSV